jgi:hypothetical protein
LLSGRVPIIHLIRQFVRVARGIEWKVCGQLFTDSRDSSDKAAREIAFSKFLRYHVHNMMPEMLTNLFVESSFTQTTKATPT